MDLTLSPPLHNISHTSSLRHHHHPSSSPITITHHPPDSSTHELINPTLITSSDAPAIPYVAQYTIRHSQDTHVQSIIPAISPIHLRPHYIIIDIHVYPCCPSTSHSSYDPSSTPRYLRHGRWSHTSLTYCSSYTIPITHYPSPIILYPSDDILAQLHTVTHPPYSGRILNDFARF